MRARRRRRLALVVGSALTATAVAAAVALVLVRGAATTTQVAMAPPAPPRATGGASAVATVVAVEGAPVAVRAGAPVVLATGSSLGLADRVVVPSGATATVGLFRGTRVVVGEGSDLRLASTGPLFAFELTAGAVRADVAKLAPEERFLVRTPDADVEVRGTSFRVSRAPTDATCGGTTTRVMVYEGTVIVRASGVETPVRGGEQWPAGCEAAPAPSAAPRGTRLADPRAPPGVAAAAVARSPSPATTGAPVPAPVLASDLAAQNDLFAAAVAKKRTGDARGAVSAFDDLLARYPATHLAQSARAERMKTLQTFDPEGARTAARDYLARYPNGFARSDADVILSGR
jgi:hypothetical protein